MAGSNPAEGMVVRLLCVVRGVSFVSGRYVVQKSCSVSLAACDVKTWPGRPVLGCCATEGKMTCDYKVSVNRWLNALRTV